MNLNTLACTSRLPAPAGPMVLARIHALASAFATTGSLLRSVTVCVAIIAIGVSEVHAATVYEGGSAGAESRWSIIDRDTRDTRDAGFSIRDDDERGKVVEFRGTLGNAYLIGGSARSWQNRTEHRLSMRLRSTSDFAAYVIVRTDKGRRTLRYRNRDDNKLAYRTGYVDHGLGTAASNGRWQTHVRDLPADLAAGEPSLQLIEVIGMIFRGSVRLDDLTLQSGGSSSGTPAPDSADPTVRGRPTRPTTPSDDSGSNVPASVPAPTPTPAPPPIDTPAPPAPPAGPSGPQVENGRLLAFPGAEGGGRFARGGRGGRVVIVDTLEDRVAADGRTSLREALETMSGARTIVFAVGGTFDTGRKTLLMDGEQDSNVTLACQTAPPPGVLIKGNGIRIRGGAHDIVMQHCGIRNIDPGKGLANSSRAIAVVGTNGDTHDLIFDHMTLGWATDENFTAFVGPTARTNVRNLTLSRSIVAEGDADSSHYESGKQANRYLHSMGPSCGSASSRYRILGCSIIGNLIAHNARRNPLMWGASGEVTNNVIYNWHETGLDARPHKPGRVDLHVTGNLFKAGPTTRRDKTPLLLINAGSSQSGYRVRGNSYRVDGTTRALANSSLGTPRLGANRVSSFRLECVGATRPTRAKFDARIISEYQGGTGRVGIGASNQRNFSGHPASRHSTAYDSDRDGMADAWEISLGLNPNDAVDANGDADKDGYTNLEEFLHSLARC